MPDTAPTLTRLGPRALRVAVGDVAEALALARFAREAGLPVEEVVPGAATVVLDGVTDRAAVESALASWRPDAAPARGPTVVEVPVRYDGADLSDVARRWGTDESGVASMLLDTDLVSAFCGFAPGFAYLAGLPPELAVPRLDAPRPRVPAGSVAVADRWCGIYPTASPGGWRLIGHTEVTLWDARADPPALLAPGSRVRLVPA